MRVVRDIEVVSRNDSALNFRLILAVSCLYELLDQFVASDVSAGFCTKFLHRSWFVNVDEELKEIEDL